MTVTLSLPPDVEAKLKERAAASGKDVNAFVSETIKESLRGSIASLPPKRSPRQWSAELHAWAASHPKLDYIVDDSRESIYEGRE